MKAFSKTLDLGKHSISLLLLVMFLVLAVASTSKKLTYTSLYHKNQVEDRTMKRNYLEREDGTRIFGDKVNLTSPLFGKAKFHLDGNVYEAQEIRGYLVNGVYYRRFKNKYIRRIVHGRINVYEQTFIRSETSYDGRFWHSSSRMDAIYYYQKGEEGPLAELGTLDDIKRLVADCPAASQMLEMKYRKIWKAVRHNRAYLNEVFDTYNNGCK